LVDRDLIVAKASSVKRHMSRVEEKLGTDLQAFLKDIDRQESILFNLQMAIQNCIDIAAHIISEEGYGVPGSTGEKFSLLGEKRILDGDITGKMVKAVGFRNLIVREYGGIELKQVFDVAQNDIKDLSEYLASVFRKFGFVD
jgi:uncharacterized protein YutE (UPF0331/DUF86 family)